MQIERDNAAREAAEEWKLSQEAVKRIRKRIVSASDLDAALQVRDAVNVQLYAILNEVEAKLHDIAVQSSISAVHRMATDLGSKVREAMTARGSIPE